MQQQLSVFVSLTALPSSLTQFRPPAHICQQTPARSHNILCLRASAHFAVTNCPLQLQMCLSCRGSCYTGPGSLLTASQRPDIRSCSIAPYHITYPLRWKHKHCWEKSVACLNQRCHFKLQTWNKRTTVIEYKLG